MIPPFAPTPAQLAVLAAEAQLGTVQVARLVKRHNDLWRLSTSAGEFYLKAYTKDWYGDDVAATAGCVQHEAGAYALLDSLGLPVPEVRWAGYDAALLGRPALLLAALSGLPLTTALEEAPARAPELLVQVGVFLARMHARTFDHPGYVMDTVGPTATSGPAAWGHPLWSAANLHRAALENLNDPALPAELRAELAHCFATLAADLAADFQPPCFVHGDCHASQFFLECGSAGWRVTGVLDLEVASAGAGVGDLVKLILELRRFPFDWWTPLFAGYGHSPDFRRLRLWLLATDRASWEAHGPLDWPAELRRVLAALSWRDLLT